MNHIKEVENLSIDKCVEESIACHDKYPALFSGEMDIQDTDCEEFMRDKVEMIFLKCRERWSGLENMSFCYRIDSANRKLKYTVGVSSENLTFSIYVLDFIKRFLPKLENGREMKVQSDEDSVEDDPVACENGEGCKFDDRTDKTPPQLGRSYVKPRELVQINASSDTVKSWIDSFIRSRREIINVQNIRDFCLGVEKRQNCARVDAVLVKRKDTSSHIRVEHVSNLWGPGIRSDIPPTNSKAGPPDEHSYSISKRSYQPCESTHPPNNKKKKVFSGQDVADKLTEIKLKYLI